MKTVSLIILLIAINFPVHAQPTSEIRKVLDAQVAAWNVGDVKTFMQGYNNSAATTFVGKSITKGYQEVLDNYLKRYPTKAAMGTLAFSDLEITMLSETHASVVGKWNLVRSKESGGDVAGIFTLLFEKTSGGWKIILDHTS